MTLAVLPSQMLSLSVAGSKVILDVYVVLHTSVVLAAGTRKSVRIKSNAGPTPRV